MATSLHPDLNEKETIEDGAAPVVTEKQAMQATGDVDDPAQGSQAQVPHIASPTKVRWNEPRINMYRYFAALLGFVNMGMNDASYGALIPYMEVYYHVNHTIISLVFLAPFLGYLCAAFLNNRIHNRFGQLGIAFIAPLCKIVAYAVTCAHPPYPVLPVIFTLTGFGIGLEDSGWNAWVGNMENANEMLGFLHGAYGLGATIGPLIATALVTKADLLWYNFYYIMLGLAVIELILGVMAFRTSTGAVYRASNQQVAQTTDTKTRSGTKEALFNPITWICAIFLLCYVGVEVALGGWLVTFMLKVRHGEPFASGMVVTGFWLGLTFGRVILGFVTGKIGEKIAMVIYLTICIVLELCFWLIPHFIASAIFAAWLGFFLGPLFPAVIVVATKLLPKRLHVSAIGFMAAFGGGGAAIIPFGVGAIAQAKGVQVLQPIALALIVVILALWCCLPGGFSKQGLEEFHRAKEASEAGNTSQEDLETGWVGQRTNRVRRKLGIA